MSYSVSYIDDIQQTIMLAISNQRVIQLRLGSGWRTIEPYELLYSQENEDNLLLYGYCRDTITSAQVPSRWQYFNVLEVESIELTNYCFEPLVEYYDQVAAEGHVILMAIGSKNKMLWD